ncbi:uncharacterized protein LOC124271905 isoform X2 [Haliotis rubra]|uniref:uncharacterized protein LOC124271905 isoform X2 n=1 Tax=Haliotis rubra TaxID=36100 RepID=UPI001EE59AFE|nr:uncharacterized protein LOC124271905 isoform X2 [Haliotis rubra]
MDANSDDSYNSPAEDEDTAIERSLMNLRDIEVRCRRAAHSYIATSKYENNGFFFRCAGAAVSGGTSLLAVFAGNEVMGPVVETYVKVHIRQSMCFIGIVIGIVTFLGMLKGIDSVIGAWFYEKAPKYNQAAAEWQEMELRIKAFLAAAVKGTITVQDCKLFTEECAEKRKKICLIALPDQKPLTRYQTDYELLIKRM